MVARRLTIVTRTTRVSFQEIDTASRKDASRVTRKSMLNRMYGSTALSPYTLSRKYSSTRYVAWALRLPNLRSTVLSFQELFVHINRVANICSPFPTS